MHVPTTRRHFIRLIAAIMSVARLQARRMRQLASQLGAFIADVYRFRPHLTIYTAVLMSVLSVTEGIGLVMLVPLIGFVGAGNDTGPQGGQRLHDMLNALFGFFGVSPTLEHVLGIFLILAIVRPTLNYHTSMCSARLENGYLNHIRTRLYAALSHADWTHLLDLRQSHTSHRLTLQAEQVGYAVGYLLTGIATFLNLLAGVAVAWIASPTLTVTVLLGAACLAACLLVLHWWAFARAAAAMRAMQHLFRVLGDGLDSLKLGRAFSIEPALAKEFADASVAYKSAAIDLRKNETMVTVAHEAGSVLLLVLLVYASLRVFKVSSIDILLLIAIFSRLLPRAMSLQSNVRLLVASLPDYNNLVTAQAAADSAREPGNDRITHIPFEHTLELRNVSYRHRPDTPLNSLSEVSFELPARSSLGIIGPSGAGKSTLADLVAGFVAPSSGSVIVDGRPIDDELRRSWRTNVVYVDQHSSAFNDTIRANVALKATNIGDEEIWHALDLVRAADLVRALPLGLSTVVGEAGARLSGGELQRLRLASALLCKPGLLILDEAMSALSPADERAVIASIAHELAKTTVLTIAHRLSSVSWTSRVLVLDSGLIVAQGATSEVLSQESFADILDSGA